MAKPGRRTQSKPRRRAWLLAGGAVALLVAAGLLLLARPTETPPLAPGNDPRLGDASAPVVVYEFADFQCPSCRAFEEEGLDRLRARWIDTGDAQLVFKDFPIIGPDSWAAAQASQYVWERHPDLYWAWHRGLYDIQGAENAGWATAERLAAYTQSGFPTIDAEDMRRAVASNEFLEEASLDADEGSDRGVRGTPTLVIGGKLVNGNDAAAVDAAIEEALQDARA